MKLVIVESPTKAKTIAQFLGKGYKVESSFGHIRDLPKSKMGVDVENNFEPKYIIPTASRKKVTALKKEVNKADEVILAPDEDREGEAIAWHLQETLQLQKLGKTVKRIVFHEITKSAILEALKTPRDIDINLVNAQQARRVLDRLVGYMLSPFLWKKLMRGLSAGRVQSAALRLIVEREEEIRHFKKQEFWSLHANLLTEKKEPFTADLHTISGKALEKMGISSENDVQTIIKDLEKSNFKVNDISEKQLSRNPLPPFTTSTLQQEANKRLHLTSKYTMRLAQNLYEKGDITYMRTDSVNLSGESLAAAHKYLTENYGSNYALASPRKFQNKSKMAQEAHEAIRPTDPSRTAEMIKTDAPQEKKLYDLIRRRFLASQMPAASFQTVTVKISAAGKNKNYEFRSRGTRLLFDGFLKVWPSAFEDTLLPVIKINENLELVSLKPEQHFTEPPPRYNEASLVKILEEKGIGRPSTYAPIISVIQARHYVEKNEARRFQPTEVGEMTNKLLTEHFPEVVDINFTAKMEDGFDAIAENSLEWHELIKKFYTPFSAKLDKKYEEVKKENYIEEEKTNEVCEKCGKPMAVKRSRFGKFLACTGFPECRNTKKLIATSGPLAPVGKCPDCTEGRVVIKRTRKGRMFYGCNRYPECKYASWKKPELQAVVDATSSTEKQA